MLSIIKKNTYNILYYPIILSSIIICLLVAIYYTIITLCYILTDKNSFKSKYNSFLFTLLFGIPFFYLFFYMNVLDLILKSFRYYLIN